MVGILHRGILNTKTIYHKAKCGVLVIMEPNARCVLYGMIKKWGHMFHQLLVIDYIGLFESIHALFDAHVDTHLVVYQCSEVVHINDFLRDDLQWNAHKFRV